MTRIIGLLFICAGVAGWVGVISLLLTWWALCFGTVIVGIVILIFAPPLLVLPLALSVIPNGLLATGFVMLAGEEPAPKTPKAKSLQSSEPQHRLKISQQPKRDFFNSPELDDGIENYKGDEGWGKEKKKQKYIKSELKTIKRVKRVEASHHRIKWYCCLAILGLVSYTLFTSTSWRSVNQHKVPLRPITAEADEPQTKANENTRVSPNSSVGNTGKLLTPSWHHKAWRVASVNDYVMINATNSEHGNFLGVLRRLDDCNNRSIMLSLKADLADNADIYGENVNLRFFSGNKVITTIQAKVTLIKTLFQSQYGQEIEYTISPIPQKLLLAFKQKSSIQIEVSDSLQFEDGISLYGAKFDLTGFTATHLKANEYCLGNN